MFNDKWQSAAKAKGEEAQREGYSAALNFIYRSYNIFQSKAKIDQFYFRYGASRGKSINLMDTDHEVGTGLEGTIAGKVGIMVYNESIQEITNGKYSFGMIVQLSIKFGDRLRLKI